jgi:hypothetical protein
MGGPCFESSRKLMYSFHPRRTLTFQVKYGTADW